MNAPTQTCKLCGRVEIVTYGRGFPPDAAKRRLKKWCNSNGCPSDPVYRAGFHFGGPVVGQASPGNAETKGPKQ